MTESTTPGPKVGLRTTDPDAFNIEAARDQQDRAAAASSQASAWAPVAIGGVLAWLGLSRRSFGGLILGALGGAMAWGGLTGKLRLFTGLAPDGEASVRIEESVTINRPVDDVYHDWHDIESLPRILTNILSVRDDGDGRSHWVAAGPMGKTVSWDAEVLNDDENRVLSWRSVGQTPVPNVGAVHFQPTPDGQGTELRVRIEYSPPGGQAGAAVAKLLGSDPSAQVAGDLRRFKSYVETGVMPTTEGQPAARPGSTVDAVIEKVTGSSAGTGNNGATRTTDEPAS